MHHRTEVVAVYHRDRQKAEAIAQAHQIPHACDTVDALVALPEVQAVSISTPPFLHYDAAAIALKAGKHLLLEKPTTLTLAEAVDLYYLAHAHSAVTGLDFEFRFVPTWQRCAELLAEGFVGQPRLVKIDCLVSSRADPGRSWNWYSQRSQGGGMLGALGSHVFDYIHWLFGAPQRLCGSLSTAIYNRPEPTTGALKPVDADDTCSITLELANGSLCQVLLSSVTYQGRGHWVEVYGDRGTLVLGNPNLKDYVHGFRLWGAATGEVLVELEIPKRLAFPQTYEDGRLAPFIRVVDGWVQGIEQGRSIAPSLKEGVYSQLLMELTERSHQTRQWVEIPPLETVLFA
jgi:predicted dehydrogenase